ncbi:MAG: carboxyltransferase domain-containing protein [Pseudomonadota bacterium]|nr:carboxyltransferase domain-containing protein [Pseudomonadota bacterium]
MTDRSTRFTFGGDEHLLCECSEDMSFESFFKSLNATKRIREKQLTGVIETCGGNAAYLVRFDPDIIHPDKLLEEIKIIDKEAENAEPVLNTRITEMPVFYQDPWTRETMNQFPDRRQDPNATDLEYAARINGLSSVEQFINAHHRSPWFVSQVGFVCGVPWLYQMVERERQLEVPKYVRPRTDTPRHTIGHGGCFAAIYAVRGAGGYQMFGITPMPIFEPDNPTSYFKGSMVFSKPGDIVKFRPIQRAEYDEIVNCVQKGTYEPPVKSVQFDLREFLEDMDGYNKRLTGVLYGS